MFSSCNAIQKPYFKHKISAIQYITKYSGALHIQYTYHKKKKKKNEMTDNTIRRQEFRRN